MGIAKRGAKTGASRSAWCLLIAIGMFMPAHARSQETGSLPETSAGAAAPKAIPSPPAKASVVLDGKNVTISYSQPSVRGRKVMGGLVPYGKVWRTGANPATTLTTATSLTIGDLKVPAGKYTIYSLPSEGTWKLIINKQTGQWGTDYDQKQDLGRVDMHRKPLSQAQEVFTIGFENTKGDATELHLKWENTDVFVPVMSK